MEILDRTEESGLDKLIKSLTEHCRKHYGFKDNDDIEIDHDSIQFHLYYKAKRCFSIGVEKVISKEFGFIQWLVDNDKIDQHKFYDKNILKGFMTLTKEEKTDSIIMNLSIQDNPIEYLVSILK